MGPDLLRMEPDATPTGTAPSLRIAAAAIRDAIEALEGERPDIARRLAELADELEATLGAAEDPPVG